jgi:multidrug efflux system outer membrane protein
MTEKTRFANPIARSGRGEAWRRLALLATVATLAGCSLIPDYHRPDAPVATAYPDGPAYRSGSGASDPRRFADSIGWRDFFTDPRLVALIDIGLKNNRDLRVAALNVAAAQAQFRVQRADLFPSISASGTGLYEGLPNSTTIPESSGGSSSSQSGVGSSELTQTASQGGTYRYYTASLGFTSYELDLFGRVRSLSRKAYEAYLSDAETQRSTQISLVAQIGSAYLTYLADQELLRISRDTLASQSDSYRLTKAMLDSGTTTLLSLRQVETSVATAQANIAQYTRQVAQDENALTLLLGEPIPADLPPAATLDSERLVADIPAGLPSDLVERRPDILAAEHTLLGANANIGAARAAFFPSISLTASDGVASNKLSALFTGGATTWTFSPSLNIPIFTFGANQGNLDLAKVQTRIEVANYEKAIQTAFREVSDALAARATYRDQIRAQQALVDAAADSYRLSEMRFRSGVDSFLSALDSQRTLYSAQQTLVSLKLAELTNLVTLYKALGGGWRENTVTAAVADKP